MDKKRVAAAAAYLLLALILGVFALKYYLYDSKNTVLQLPKDVRLQEGDLVLRRETNRISDIFAHINASDYSHIGTLLVSKNRISVVHIEESDEGDDFHVVSLDTFLQYSSKYAFYRPKHRMDARRLHSFVEKIKKKNPDFDMEFSGKEDNLLYCTELAYEINRYATSFDIVPKMTRYMNYRFISINEFSDSSNFSILYKSE